MPGYGIADAATTLVGQSMGAGRRDLTRRFAYITVFMGMLIMGVMGVIMYVAAPQILGVIGTLPSFIASIQANECIKALTGCGPCLDNRLFTCDLLSMQTHCFDLQPTDSGRDISLQNFQKLIASSTR